MLRMPSLPASLSLSRGCRGDEPWRKREGCSMSVSLKSLIGKLNDTCRSALEAAAGLCLTRTHYDVDIEHLFLKLCEAQDTDLQRLLRHYEIDQARLSRDLTRALDRLKTGNARTPALSPRIPRLISEAWTHRLDRLRRHQDSLGPPAARAAGKRGPGAAGAGELGRVSEDLRRRPAQAPARPRGRLRRG